MYSNENKRLKQIDLSIIGVIIFIFVLIHSIYILVSEKKQILNIETISNQEMITQALLNRVIAFIIIFMFFYFSISNYNDLLQSDDEERKNDQLIRVIVSFLALLSVSVEIYLSLKELANIDENKSNSN